MNRNLRIGVAGEAITPPRNYSISDVPRDGGYRITGRVGHPR